MANVLIKFKNLEIDKAQLKNEIGEDLYNADCSQPVVLNKEDLIKVIQSYINDSISLQQLVDWVNVVWFTDLYEILEDECDSIMSVLEVLETLDESETLITLEEFSKMIKVLSNKGIYS